jgi:hypothetical protein
MVDTYNHRIFVSLIKDTLLLQLVVAAIWFFIYKLYKYDVRNGKLIFLINVVIYIFCVAYLINDLYNYPDLRVGVLGFGCAMGILALSLIATFLLVVEYFIIKLIIRTFKNHNS